MIKKGKILRYYSDSLALVDMGNEIIRAIPEIFIPEGEVFFMLVDEAESFTKIVPLQTEELDYFVYLNNNGIKDSYSLLQIFKILKKLRKNYRKISVSIFRVLQKSMFYDISLLQISNCLKNIVNLPSRTKLYQFIQSLNADEFYAILQMDDDIWLVILPNADELFIIDPKLDFTHIRNSGLITENKMIFNELNGDFTKTFIRQGFDGTA